MHIGIEEEPFDRNEPEQDQESLLKVLDKVRSKIRYDVQVCNEAVRDSFLQLDGEVAGLLKRVQDTQCAF